MIAHQRLEAVRGLVVGRVRLEDELRLPADERAERLRLARPVVDDLVVVELDAGLHHERDDARPGRLEPARDERARDARRSSPQPPAAS